jgi:hypothetical protein
MSKRSVGDYIRDAFFARDKASLAAIVQDAESAGIPMQAPDDDDDSSKQAIVIHNHHNPAPAADATTDDNSITGRVTRLEDSFKTLSGDVRKVLDAMPPWLSGKADPDDDDKKDDPAQMTDEPPPASEGPDEEGDLTAEKLGEVEPDLMNADPALKTGKSQMGDAAYNARVVAGLSKLIKDVKARAEILAPGLRATIDAKPTRATQDALCGIRRAALLGASRRDAGRKALGRFDDKSIGKMSCDAVRVLFLDASDRMRDSNNATLKTSGAAQTFVDERSFRETQQQRIRDMNKANREFWDKQTGRDHRDTLRH